jgi:uncharacterized lipoprotein YbaY/heat shock protein HslJ
MRIAFRLIGWTLAIVSWASAQGATVTGRATYLERIAMPPDAVFIATLEDVSRMDAKSVVLGTHRKESAGNPPYDFSISYDPAKIVPSGRYVVRARLLVDGKLRFTSDRSIPVLTQGHGAEVPGMIRMVGVSSGTTMRGEFTYMADAASFRLCSTGKTYPVAMEGGYLAVERAYTKLGKPGELAALTVVGTIEKRPIGEGGQPVDAIVIQRLVRIVAGAGCSATLSGYFKLTAVGGKTITAKPGRPEPHIRLDPAKRHLTGHGGCNSISGPYSANGDAIRIGPLAATMMACIDGGDIEPSFFKALDQVRRWKLNGPQLLLLDESGGVLLTLTSSAPR